jgi:hypothetical protein
LARSLTGFSAHAACAARARATMADISDGAVAVTATSADPSTGLTFANGEGVAPASVVGSLMAAQHTPLVFASRQGYVRQGGRSQER